MKHIKEIIVKEKLDAILFTSRVNNFYLTQFKSSYSFILITKDRKFYFTDSRYILDSKKNIDSSFEIVLLNNKSNSALLDTIKKFEIKKIGFEANDLSYYSYKNLSTKLKGIDLIDMNLDNIRIIKDSKEMTLMNRASEIAIMAWNETIKRIKGGISEKDIELLLINNLIKFGASKPSFDIIVAGGKNGANPHWSPSDYVIKNGDFVTIDFGALYQGYCSDITRTIVVGKNKNLELSKIYNIVLEANKKAIEFAKPGIRCKELDLVARDYISKNGYGEKFNHSLGHGLGIKVHEEPMLNNLSNTILKEGMVVTIEPGIYVKNLGGVRIEDIILITKTGCINLTKNLPKSLMEIDN